MSTASPNSCVGTTGAGGVASSSPLSLESATLLLPIKPSTRPEIVSNRPSNVGPNIFTKSKSIPIVPINDPISILIPITFATRRFEPNVKFIFPAV